MRRMSGRSPPFVIIGVIVVCSFLSYNLWTLSSENDDIINQLKKLQIEVKVCGAKQLESEKSASLLLEQVNELKSKLEESNKFVEEDKNIIKKTGNELANLRNEQTKLQKTEEYLKQDMEGKDSKILEIEKKLQNTIDIKDEAESVIAEKDQLINKLQLNLEQVKRNLQIAYAQGNEDPLITNTGKKGAKEVSPNKLVNTKAKGLSGLVNHPGMEMLPQQSPNVERRKPKFSVKDVTRKPETGHNSQVQVPSKNQADLQQLNNVQSVIHNPESLKNEPENPDTAIDEEEKNVEDPADDQDEEGKEIKHDLEALPKVEDGKKIFDEFNNNVDYEEDDERNGLQKNAIPKGEHLEPRGIGKMNFPRSKDKAAGDDYVNFGAEPDHNEVKANDRLYETNLSNKIRNIGKF